MDDGLVTFRDYFMNHENLIANINELLSQIERSDIAYINFDKKDRVFLFYLGMLFANGIKIKLANEDEIDFEDEGFIKNGKSFSMMVYVWSKLFDPEWPDDKLYTDLQILLENVKRLGLDLSLRKIPNCAQSNKLFLICPVSDASEETNERISNYKSIMASYGYDVHAPFFDTNQKDMFAGYAICRQNAEAIGKSKEVEILYDQKSNGSVFDLGVAYALHKPIRVLNDKSIQFTDDVIDLIIQQWPFNENKKSLKNVYFRVKTRVRQAFKK